MGSGIQWAGRQQEVRPDCGRADDHAHSACSQLVTPCGRSVHGPAVVPSGPSHCCRQPARCGVRARLARLSQLAVAFLQIGLFCARKCLILIGSTRANACSEDFARCGQRARFVQWPACSCAANVAKRTARSTNTGASWSRAAWVTAAWRGRVLARGVSPQPRRAEMRATQRATADSRVGTVSLRCRRQGHADLEPAGGEGLARLAGKRAGAHRHPALCRLQGASQRPVGTATRCGRFSSDACAPCPDPPAPAPRAPASPARAPSRRCPA